MMNKIFFVLAWMICVSAYAQDKRLEVQGAMQVGNTNEMNPAAGTIRWTGTDFEGFNGEVWLSLTQGNQYIYDIDNNQYRVVTIGTQTWMADNLRVTRYNDGTEIPLVTTNNTEWENMTTAAYTWYFGVDAIGNEYRGADSGALYNFYVVADSNALNVCPMGWHVPTMEEWQSLATELGGVDVAGGKLKTTGLEHWAIPNGSATNESKFNAIPGGRREFNGVFADDLISVAYWWSTTEFDGDPNLLAYYSAVDYFDDELTITFGSKVSGQSIRCVKD